MQWQAKLERTLGMYETRGGTGHSAFNDKMHANFAAYVKIWMGELQVVKFIIHFGVGPPGDAHPMEQLIAAMRDSSDCGAEESAVDASKSSRLALEEQRALCEARQLERSAYCKRNELGHGHMSLCDAYNHGTLAREVDEANNEYSHGVARTHEYEFEPGQNMCRLESKCDAIALAPSKQQEQPEVVDPAWSCDAIALASSKQQEQPEVVDPAWSAWALLAL